jgi:hypothetical protein
MRVPVVMPIHVRWRLARRIRGRLHSKSATDAAKNAADDAADNNAKRSRCLIANSRAMRNAIGDALCLRSQWASE